MTGRRRGHRRVVAPATNAAAARDDPGPSTGEPRAADAGAPPRARRPGGAVLPDRATEDTDGAWGGPAEDSNEARLERDRPPHWQ